LYQSQQRKGKGTVYSNQTIGAAAQEGNFGKGDCPCGETRKKRRDGDRIEGRSTVVPRQEQVRDPGGACKTRGETRRCEKTTAGVIAPAGKETDRS